MLEKCILLMNMVSQCTLFHAVQIVPFNAAAVFVWTELASTSYFQTINFYTQYHRCTAQHF